MRGDKEAPAIMHCYTAQYKPPRATSYIDLNFPIQLRRPWSTQGQKPLLSPNSDRPYPSRTVVDLIQRSRNREGEINNCNKSEALYLSQQGGLVGSMGESGELVMMRRLQLLQKASRTSACECRTGHV